MTIQDAKGKLIFLKDSDKSIRITDYIYYNGTDEHKVYFSDGYGADEKQNNLTFKGVLYLNEWLSKFELNKKPMETPTKVETISKERDTLNDLLIQTIKEVRSGEIPIEQAKAVSMLAQTLVNSAKVQIEILKLEK